MEDGCAVTRSSCWEATVDRDFPHHSFLCETTLLLFRVWFRVPAFRLSQLPRSRNERQLHKEQLYEETMLLRSPYRLLNKVSHLTAFFAWDSSSISRLLQRSWWGLVLARMRWLCITSGEACFIREMWFIDNLFTHSLILLKVKPHIQSWVD